MSDEKLAAIGSRARVCHGEFPRSGMPQGRIELILKLISRTASSTSMRTATLNHKLVDNPMKVEPVIVLFIDQVNKTRNRDRCLIREKSQVDCAFAGFNTG